MSGEDTLFSCNKIFFLILMQPNNYTLHHLKESVANYGRTIDYRRMCAGGIVGS